MKSLGLALCAIFGFGPSLFAHSQNDKIMGDSGIEGPPYREIVQMMDKLTQDYPEWLSLVRYGKSVAGVDLTLLKLESPIYTKRELSPKSRSAVLITGSTHGNEYLHIEDRLPQEFVTKRAVLPGLQKYLDQGGVIYLLPILNPDGYNQDRRENLNGSDLNRDFPLGRVDHPGFYQPETRVLADYLREDLAQNDLKLKLAVDYHCCVGALLYPWSYTAEAMPPQDLAIHRLIAQKMIAIFGNAYDYGTTGEVLGYRPLGTSKDYYYYEYGAISYTFEGKYRTEANQFLLHVRWWDSIFEMLSGGDALVNRSIETPLSF